MSTPADKLTALGFSAPQAALLVSMFGSGGTTPQVAIPVFVPAAGSYTGAQAVAITSATNGATIYYTTDGSTPTYPATGTTQVYQGLINIASTATLQAIAVLSGYTNSYVAAGLYTITSVTPPPSQTTTPIISPPGGTFSSAQTVTLSCVTGAATIYFTTDGSTPTTNSTKYVSPITVSSSQTIKAIAFAVGYTVSVVATAAFVINVPTAVAPAFSPAGGTYTSTQSVTLSSTTSGVTMYYTTDGSQPTYPVSGTTQTYSAPISVSASETINAIAVGGGFATSVVSSATYVITTQAAAPTFSPAAGSYTGTQNVSLSGPSGAVIVYTTDGTTPTYPPTGTTQTYSAAIPIPTSAVGTPTFSPAAGSFTSTQSVTLASTSGATIYYTVDGTTPSTASTPYTGPITVSASQTIKAIAALAGTVSAVGSAAYIINSGGGGGSATLIYDMSVGVANASAVSGAAEMSGTTAVLLPSGAGHASGCIFYINGSPTGTNGLVNLTNGFTVDFTFVWPDMPTQEVVCGMAFIVQNTPLTPVENGGANPYWNGHLVAGDANCSGYGSFNPATYGPSEGGYQSPLFNSIGVKFDANPLGSGQVAYNASAGLPSSVGLYQNAGPWNGLAPMEDVTGYGINFYSSHVFNGVLVYDGSSKITLTLTDTTTGASIRKVWPCNIQNTIGGNSGYIGFVAGMAPSIYSGPQGVSLTAWKLYTGYLSQLATPTASSAPGSYSAATTVTLSGSGTIYYTTDGTLPTSFSSPYTGPITLSNSTILQWVALQSGATDSAVGGGLYQINTPNTINYPSGFAAGDGVLLRGVATLSGSSIQMSSGTANTASAAWFAVPVNITSGWSTTFQLQYGAGASANGLAFVIQNQQPANTSDNPNALWSGGADVISINGGAGGYGASLGNGGSPGIANSIALYFDLYSTPNSVGYYTNGATPSGNQSASTLTFSGNTFNCTVSYSGTTLQLVMAQVGGGSKTLTWTGVNLPSIVNGNFAYIGFTAATGGLTATQKINNWTFTP